MLCTSGGRAQALVVHHDDVFGEHHLAHAPEAVHDFIGLHRVGLADAHEDKVLQDQFFICRPHLPQATGQNPHRRPRSWPAA